jgi:hypothetical protein
MTKISVPWRGEPFQMSDYREPRLMKVRYGLLPSPGSFPIVFAGHTGDEDGDVFAMEALKRLGECADACAPISEPWAALRDARAALADAAHLARVNCLPDREEKYLSAFEALGGVR